MTTKSEAVAKEFTFKDLLQMTKDAIEKIDGETSIQGAEEACDVAMHFLQATKAKIRLLRGAKGNACTGCNGGEYHATGCRGRRRS